MLDIIFYSVVIVVAVGIYKFIKTAISDCD